jgi:hypothetical protein
MLILVVKSGNLNPRVLNPAKKFSLEARPQPRALFVCQGPSHYTGAPFSIARACTLCVSLQDVAEQQRFQRVCAAAPSPPRAATRSRLRPAARPRKRPILLPNASTLATSQSTGRVPPRSSTCITCCAHCMRRRVHSPFIIFTFARSRERGCGVSPPPQTFTRLRMRHRCSPPRAHLTTLCSKMRSPVALVAIHRCVRSNASPNHFVRQ